MASRVGQVIVVHIAYVPRNPRLDSSTEVEFGVAVVKYRIEVDRIEVDIFLLFDFYVAKVHAS